MEIPCDKCETAQFCIDINRCINVMCYDAYGDGDVDDREDELTSDRAKGLKKGTTSDTSGDLSENVIDILKAAIKN